MHQSLNYTNKLAEVFRKISRVTLGLRLKELEIEDCPSPDVALI
jgi:hypothetical protein